MKQKTPKTYTVRRIVEELYEVEAASKKEALDKVGENGDPHSITVIKETVKLSNNAK
jgi:hypothetical protein